MNYKKLDRNLSIHKIEINLGIFIKHLYEIKALLYYNYAERAVYDHG